MESFYTKMPLVAVCYQAAFKALSDLDRDGECSQCFKLLDLSSNLHLPRCELDDPHKEMNQGENQRMLSWIWLVARECEHGDSSTEVELMISVYASTLILHTLIFNTM